MIIVNWIHRAIETIIIIVIDHVYNIIIQNRVHSQFVIFFFFIFVFKILSKLVLVSISMFY